MKFLSKLSLRIRLTIFFLLITIIAWLCASLAAWKQTGEELDRLFDTQQMLFARQLSAMELEKLGITQNQHNKVRPISHHNLDDTALAFAIFSRDGKMLVNDGKNGRKIPFTYRRDGFTDGYLQHQEGYQESPSYFGDDDDDDDDNHEEWRFLWLTSADGKSRIVVGQEWDYRQHTALDIIISQLTPWLIALPVMILAMILLLGKELHPLKKLAAGLRKRAPEQHEPIEADGLPAEVLPLVDSLNHLFLRTQQMMQKERRFTSDAAHELRSPLTALRVQTEVALMSEDDPIGRKKALENLHMGVDRASRLIDQLLALSRLDSIDSLEEIETVPMADLLKSVIMDNYSIAQEANIDIRLNLYDESVCCHGHELLLGLMIRNLLDNAIRYSPSGSTVDITLESDRCIVRDNGPGISEEILGRVGERFYRPPGQTKTGSGLGISIVKRIAALHHMTTKLSNHSSGGFIAEIRWGNKR